ALFAAADAEGDGIAIIDASTGTAYSYRMLADAALRFAAALHDRGLQDGDRVASYLDKTFESVVAFYGTWAAGGVAVPVNGTLRSAQVKHIVEHSESRFFVSTPRKLQALKDGAVETADIVLIETDRNARDPERRRRFPRGSGPLAPFVRSSSEPRQG